jgi:hypothetical protein
LGRIVLLVTHCDIQAPTEEGNEYRSGTKRFSSPRTIATLSSVVVGFFINSFSIPPAILLDLLFFGVPIT